MIRYKTYKIQETPTEKFPEMVTVVKGKKIEKKFINLEKAKLWIEVEQSLKLISKGGKKIEKELDTIGLTEPVW